MQLGLYTAAYKNTTIIFFGDIQRVVGQAKHTTYGRQMRMDPYAGDGFCVSVILISDKRNLEDT